MVCTALPNPVCGKGRGQIPEQNRGLDLCKGRERQRPQPLLCQPGSASVRGLASVGNREGTSLSSGDRNKEVGLVRLVCLY